MKRIDSFSVPGLLTLALLSFGACRGAAAAPPTGKDKAARNPNVLLIVVDDLGYADLGCQGCKDIATPNIDTLAKNGIRCTNGYVSCPVCSPSRAGLLTGRYQQRFGHEFNPETEELAPREGGLPLTEVTLADRLKSAGYVTGIIGKWHLGYKEQFHPQKRGFDEFFGFLGGSRSYERGASTTPIQRGLKEVDEKEYLTDAFTRETVAFIDRHRAEPFFLYLAYNAVHAPMQTPPKYRTRFANIKDDNRRIFAGMLSSLDDGVGAVLAKLKQAGIEEDTLIFFISDNGGPTVVTTSRNDPLKGGKGHVWEGGIRIPFLVQWKAQLPANKVYDKPIIALDVVPTAVAIAGCKIPEDANLDGVNLVPFLSGQNDKLPHDILFWRSGDRMAVRKGNWKLVKDGMPSPQLFDLEPDVGEQKDLAGDHPERVKELNTDLNNWDSQLSKPLWGKLKGQ